MENDEREPGLRMGSGGLGAQDRTPFAQTWAARIYRSGDRAAALIAVP